MIGDGDEDESTVKGEDVDASDVEDDDASDVEDDPALKGEYNDPG